LVFNRNCNDIKILLIGLIIESFDYVLFQKLSSSVELILVDEVLLINIFSWTWSWNT